MIRHLATLVAAGALVGATGTPAHAGTDQRTYVNGQTPVTSCAASVPVSPTGATCFSVSGGSVTIVIDDASGLDVGATAVFRKSSALGGTVLGSSSVCNSRTLGVPAGADELVIYLDGADDTARSLRDQGACLGASAATTGTITVSS